MKHNKLKINFPESKLISNNINSLDENVLNLKAKTSKLKNNIIDINTDIKNLSNSIETNELISDIITTNNLISDNLNTNLINIEKGYLNIVDEITDKKDYSLVNQIWVLNQLDQHGEFHPEHQINLTDPNISLTTTGNIIVGYVQNNSNQNNIILYKEGNINANGNITAKIYKINNLEILKSDNYNNIILNIDYINTTIQNNDINIFYKNSNKIIIDNIDNLTVKDTVYIKDNNTDKITLSKSGKITGLSYNVNSTEIIKLDSDKINVDNIDNLTVKDTFYIKDNNTDKITLSKSGKITGLSYNVNSTEIIKLDSDNVILNNIDNIKSNKIQTSNITNNQNELLKMYSTTNNIELFVNSQNTFNNNAIGLQLDKTNNKINVQGLLNLKNGGQIINEPTNENDIINLKYFNEHTNKTESNIITYKLCDDDFTLGVLLDKNLFKYTIDDNNNSYLCYIIYKINETTGEYIISQKIDKIDEQNNITNLYINTDITTSFIIEDILYKNNKLYCIINNDYNTSSNMHSNYLLKSFDIINKTFSNEIVFTVNNTKLYPYSFTTKTINDNVIYIGTINSKYFISYNISNNSKTYYSALSSGFNNNYAMTQILLTKNNNIYLILNEYTSSNNDLKRVLYFVYCSNLSSIPNYMKIDLSLNSKISNLYNYDVNNTTIYYGDTNNDNNNILLGLYNASGFLIFNPDVSNNNLTVYNFMTGYSSVYNSINLEFNDNYQFTNYIKYVYYDNKYYCIFILNSSSCNSKGYMTNLIICTPLDDFTNSYILLQNSNILYVYDINNFIINNDFSLTNIYKIKFNNQFIQYSTNIGLNGNVFCNSLNSYNIKLLNRDILDNNKTIIHNAPIMNNIDNYIVGNPVFLSEDNKIYILQINNNKIENNKIENKYDLYTYLQLTNKNYIKKSCDQVPKVSCINNGKFIGVIVNVIPKNTIYTLRDSLNTKIIIDVDTIDFATHGDYIFKIQNNIEHNLTFGGSRMYQIGDEILYDGTIIDQNYPITRLQENNSVGIITYIPEDNTDYVSVFKK